MQKLGTGVLNWNPEERKSDRYGAIFLNPSIGSEEMVPLVQVKNQPHGRLIAIVEETRQSRHIGDLFHGVYPKTPKKGQKIVLGEGELFFTDDNMVGLKPDDGRDTLWLKIRALYRVHEQTVTLCFEEIPKEGVDSFST
jgi:hypothetical protein